MGKSVKERLMLFLKERGISQGKFEKAAGLSNGYISKLAKNPSPEKLQNMFSAYPELNPDWVIYGKGTMLKKRDDGNVIEISSDDIKEAACDGVPVYDVDATCGGQLRQMDFTEEHIVGTINLPQVSRDSVIIKANGDSMRPKVQDGDLIAVRQVYDLDNIFYGQIYLIVLEEYRLVKYIRKHASDPDNYVILRSENENYDDMEVKKTDIRKLFIVENVLSITTRL